MRLIFLCCVSDPKEGTSQDLDHEQIDINIAETESTSIKSPAEVSRVSETETGQTGQTSRSPQVDAPGHVLVADTADRSAPLAPSEEHQNIREVTSGDKETDKNERRTPDSQSTERS